ncbi:helix-turn-helix domain-containing protein [Panacibacter ginsenosidivorans]|uniref:Helix-turn-helix domain-containing protein n=1 Tax=Panacibacter ginsenosidivorans TaxID=1813871 RepID=A0A5B8V5K9_9BACT|nr:AraC family transcriptional regulator [Panacibacter ginsenosidivorans]QEC66355.1 helix-turn-helix domain-containing protein [Panacibacter ginsenosidivorans]
MKLLHTGQFHGQTNNTVFLNGLTLTDTEYTQDKVDWHYHQNAYFTFILQGNVIEGNKKEVFNCSAGDLLFHNWQEPHYNIKPRGFTRGFHIELQENWLQNLHFSLGNLTGSMNIKDPDLKLSLYKIFKETKINDQTSQLSIESLLLQVLKQIIKDVEMPSKKNPTWVTKIREILNETFCDKLTLSELSNSVGIHPSHLSRGFPIYFQCTIGNYIRKLKIQKSLTLLPKKNISLSAIAFECGFADQSHFIRCFKDMLGIAPFTYRKLILS